MAYILAALVAVVIIGLWAALRKQRKLAGIAGWVQSQDLDGRGKRVYRDRKTGISSKPDVVERDRVIEYKSASVDQQARWPDMMQLAMEMHTASKPRAELRYANKRFAFKRDDRQMKAALREALGIAGRMRRHLLAGTAPAARPDPRRCGSCLFSTECAEAVVH